ncbi:hypothetical protein BWQ96_09546 [Gracilariopsis chorda]|uniref:Uncharacterized protein n=1 Tax=Gracilariopsis chorda TaxID=448386 RepID=A0A2V3IF76_9FLOR|nr:hypothetical protein BWQ96_09906 [Gracilariopsis chorda]PXF40713.1 hypothetical protein BWQ96_09546 [Gracilariopsis chorda]|eukprot:PXF40388.1 hypothetical protein BWQ96_09906 [Gracilariopsis chorda]
MNVAFGVVAETGRAKNQRLPLPLVPRITKANFRRAGVFIRRKDGEWCLEYPGFSLVKEGTGCRGKRECTNEHVVDRSMRIVGTREKGLCLVFAVVNTVARLVDFETA